MYVTLRAITDESLLAVLALLLEKASNPLDQDLLAQVTSEIQRRDAMRFAIRNGYTS